MPSEMYERGRRDAEADALDENYYHYYYDYKLAYDEVERKRRRSKQQRIARRIIRWALITVPIVLVLAGIAYTASRSSMLGADASITETPTVTATLRPTLVPPTEIIEITPTPELALQPEGYAIITGTQGIPLRARLTPGTDKDDIVARFPEGETVRVIDGPQSANDMTWWHIEAQGKQGWASATYLQPVAPPQ